MWQPGVSTVAGILTVFVCHQTKVNLDLVVFVFGAGVGFADYVAFANVLVARVVVAAAAQIVIEIEVVGFAIAHIVADEFVIDDFRDDTQAGNDADHKEYLEQYLKHSVFVSLSWNHVQHHRFPPDFLIGI